MERVIIPQEPSEFQTQHRTFNHWVIEDPKRAIEAGNLLLTPRRAELFTSYITGTLENNLTIAKIATNLGLSEKGFSRRITEARQIIAGSFELEREIGIANSLHRLKRESDLKTLVTKAKKHDRLAVPMILGLFADVINAHIMEVGEKEKPVFIARVTTKLEGALQNPKFEWRGLENFSHYFAKVLRSIDRDKKRRESAAFRKALREKDAKKVREEPIEDLLTLWIHKHPDKANELVDKMRPNRRLIFKAWQKGLSAYEISQLPATAGSEGSVKTLLHKVRGNLSKAAGIRLPESYKPLKHFEIQGITAGRIYDAIREGKIRGAVRYLDRYYITSETFDLFLLKRKVHKHSIPVALKSVPEPTPVTIWENTPSKRLMKFLPVADVNSQVIANARKGDGEALKLILDVFEPRANEYFREELGIEGALAVKMQDSRDLIFDSLIKHREDSKTNFTVFLFRELQDALRKFQEKFANNFAQYDQNLPFLAKTEREIFILAIAAELPTNDVAKLTHVGKKKAWRLRLSSVSKVKTVMEEQRSHGIVQVA